MRKAANSNPALSACCGASRDERTSRPTPGGYRQTTPGPQECGRGAERAMGAPRRLAGDRPAICGSGSQAKGCQGTITGARSPGAPCWARRSDRGPENRTPAHIRASPVFGGHPCQLCPCVGCPRRRNAPPPLSHPPARSPTTGSKASAARGAQCCLIAQRWAAPLEPDRYVT
jgi:hypothetical protein